ncbi:FUSC family protein [Wohlfahrtiimonas larvae]|uniref:FUSC family protein n=1 Tax=Wohlfahrtiimonas larvae TaxID=1157986 RepID=A0ABP9MXS2_9GAMM
MKEKLWFIIREAMMVNNRSAPWERAIGAALSMTIPIFIGLFFNQLQLGLIAGLGGFTYLYAFRIPYALLSKQLLFVGISIVLSAFLGSIIAPYPIAAAITMGVIAAIMIFIFNALKFIGPSAIFFVLIFALTADMPHVDIFGAFSRAGLVGLGAALSWIIAMVGFLFQPHRPEIQSLHKAYSQLIQLTQSIGTERFQHEKYLTMAALKEAEETLVAGQLPWSPSETYTRLLHLAIEGNEYMLYLGNHYAHAIQPLPSEVTQYLTNITNALKKNLKDYRPQNNVDLQDSSLQEHLQAMQQSLTHPIASLKPVSHHYNYSIRDILANALDRNSLVFVTAVRFGVITTIAALIAYSFEFTRSYWIPLSCVAIMSGSSMIATYYRAIQRSIGTLIGIIIASSILYFHPSGYVLAMIIFTFTLMTEMLIVKNYGLAVIFITPNALLLAETITQGQFSFFHFSSARIIDVIIGSAIGLIGVLLMGKRSASIRIPRILMRTLRNESQMILLLFSEPKLNTQRQIQTRLIKLKTNLSNLTALYTAAIGEIPKNKALIEYYWPIIYSMEKLAFLLEHAAENPDRPILTDDELSKILYLFEILANSAQFKEPIKFIQVPSIPNFYSIEREINTLQSAFSVHSPNI